MKFLHLADLHIGKTVNGFSMIEEQKHAFKQIIGYIATEKPSAIVIAGDIYDRAMPGVDAVKVFDDFLTDLSVTGVSILIISGNHDSADRLNFGSRLLLDKNIHLCGVYDNKIDPVTLTDELGEVNFYLLPFIKPTMLRDAEIENDIESYGDALAAALATVKIDFTKRNVLAAHQFFTKAGINPTRSESELSPVGGLDAMDITPIEGFDYAALGHLHGPQGIGAEHIRYAGSPIKYSFSEWRQEKSVTLVEMKNKGEVSIKLLALNPIHDMREIKGRLEDLLNDKISAQGDKEDYLRVILTDEEEIICPMDKLRSVYKNVMVLDLENSRTSIDLSAISTDAESFEKLSPFELFNQFFLEVNGSVMSPEQSAIVAELLEKEEAAE